MTRRPSLETISEIELQTAVVKLLHAYARPGVCWWHTPNGELRDGKTGARLKQIGVRPGVPDLAIVVDGRFHAIELKTEAGRMSSAQRVFAEELERAGGVFHVARGLDRAVKILKAIGVFRRQVAILSSSSVEP